MARQTKPAADGTGVLYIRDPELVTELDAWLAKLNRNPDAPQWTRTTLVRAIVKRAMREYGKKGEQP